MSWFSIVLTLANSKKRGKSAGTVQRLLAPGLQSTLVPILNSICFIALRPWAIGKQTANVKVVLVEVDSDRVLVVEDDPGLSAGMAELLQGWGYAVETAADGQEAIEKVARFAPAVLITDLEMPRMGGIELLQELQRELRPVNCIVITGCATLDDQFRAARLGAFTFLQKPVHPEQLKAEVQHCLEASRARASAHQTDPHNQPDDTSEASHQYEPTNCPMP